MADEQKQHEQKPQAPEEKKEEKPKGPKVLESVVDESWNAIKFSTNSIGGAGAMTGAAALFGPDGLVTAASFPIGARIVKKASGKEYPTGNFREAIAGSLFTVPAWYGIETVKQIPKAFGLDDIVTANVLGKSVSISPVVTGLTFGALIPALNAIYYPLQYVMQNKTFKGIWKDFKDNYWKGTKKTLPLSALSSIAIGTTSATKYLAPYLFPALAAANVLYRVLLSPEKIEYKKLLLPSTYLPNMLNPFYLLDGATSVAYKTGSTIYGALGGVAKGISSLASSFFEALKKTASALQRAVSAPKPAASPATQLAPTQMPALQPQPA